MSHVPTTILHYFPGRGLANVIRYTMALAGMEWTEVRIVVRQAFHSFRLPHRCVNVIQQLRAV
jgi:hypothetical protein